MTVRVYRSTDYGHPVLTGTAGTLLALLKACLVDGYGANTVSVLTQSGGVATATCVNAHGIPLGTSAKRTISGANEAGYNVEATVTSTGTSTFTYAVVGGTPAAATGTVSVKCAGSGWTKPIADSGNIGMFKQPAGSNGFCLRVDDVATANVARVVAYESMASLASGANAFPTDVQFPSGLYMVKSASSDSVERAWVLYCNGPLFYLVVNQSSIADWSASSNMGFGDFPSYRSGDVFNTILIGSANPSSHALQTLSASFTSALVGHYVARTHAQTGTSVPCNKGADSFKGAAQTSMGVAGQAYPAPADGGLYVSPVWISENSTVRGVLPGIYAPLHARPLATGDIWVPTGDLAGKTFEAINAPGTSQMFFEISDTW